MPNGGTPDIRARLRAQWSDGDIVEIMGVIALFGYLDRWNESIGSALEDLPIATADRLLTATGRQIGGHRAD